MLKGMKADGRAHVGEALAALLIAQLMTVCAAGPAQALQIIDAVDHAELTAEVSSTEVNRVALDGDRVARVIQSPGGFTVEHDPVRGDLYLYPTTPFGGATPSRAPFAAAPAARASALRAPAQTLYLGTERGFTYRLSLTVAERDSAQILIRNAATSAGSGSGDIEADGYPNELAALIRAVARREPLPGYVIVPAPNVTNSPSAGSLVEVWRGPRYTARVFRTSADGADDASALENLEGPRVAAAWLSPEGRGPDGERLAVIVEDRGAAGSVQ